MFKREMNNPVDFNNTVKHNDIYALPLCLDM